MMKKKMRVRTEDKIEERTEVKRGVRIEENRIMYDYVNLNSMKIRRRVLLRSQK